MLNLDEIMENWAVDIEPDHTEPGRELLKISKLHSKYLKASSRHVMLSKKANFDYLEMKTLKWEYYTGKLSQEELDEHGWEPFQFSLKSDLAYYMDKDKDIRKCLEKKAYHDECSRVCELIMKELNQRTWQLKSYIDYERFIGGN